MSKSLSKILAFVLSAIMIIAMPVFASAQDQLFEISSAGIASAEGDWKCDHVDTLTVRLDCDAQDFGTSDVLMTVSRESDNEVIKTVSKADAEVLYAGDYIEISFTLDATLDHAETYVFSVSENSFKDSDDMGNSAYTFSESGNLIIEAIESEPVALNPIQRLINFLEGTKIAKYLAPIIMLLRWFDSL